MESNLSTLCKRALIDKKEDKNVVFFFYAGGTTEEAAREAYRYIQREVDKRAERRSKLEHEAKEQARRAEMEAKGAQDDLIAQALKSSAAHATQISAPDELKKWKELLDIGAIDQDEYNAKKKQLLGL